MGKIPIGRNIRGLHSKPANVAARKPPKNKKHVGMSGLTSEPGGWGAGNMQGKHRECQQKYKARS